MQAGSGGQQSSDDDEEDDKFSVSSDGNATMASGVDHLERQRNEHAAPSPDEPLTLVDELGVEDLNDILFSDRGRIFSAAGRDAPVAELSSDGVLLRPAQKPFTEDDTKSEVIVYHVNERGVLLNELGDERRISGAKFRGKPIYTLGEIKPDTVKHYAGWFDDEGKIHKFYVQGEVLTADMVYRIRNRTHDGEISIFPEISTD